MQRAVNWGRSSCGVLGEELLHVMKSAFYRKKNSRPEGSKIPELSPPSVADVLQHIDSRVPQI